MRLIGWAIVGVLLAISCWQSYKRGKWMSIVITLAAVALTVVIGLSLLLFLTQGRVLYQPSRSVMMVPDDIGLAYEQVSLHTSDGETLSAWYIPADPDARTVLFCHGNAGNMSHRLDTLMMFNELGLNCLIVDYRGYGRSTGKPTEQGTYIDIKTGWNWLIESKGVMPERIILFGRSLGGSVAANVAKDLGPGALVLESTFTSYDDMASHLYPFLPVRWFTKYNYNTLEAAKAVHCPVLVIHSPDDEIIPYKFSEKLFAAANEPKQFAKLEGTHNEGYYENAELYKQIWRDWLQQLPVK